MAQSKKDGSGVQRAPRRSTKPSTKNRNMAEFLLDVFNRVAAAGTLDDKLETIVEITTSVLGAERGTLFLNDQLNGKDAQKRLPLMVRALESLRAGEPARRIDVAPGERRAFRELHLLTSKPVLYVCNVDEASAASGNAYSERVAAWVQDQGARSVVISAAIEAELAALGDSNHFRTSSGSFCGSSSSII